MIRVTITNEACIAIERTLPIGTVGVDPDINETGERQIWPEPYIVDKLRHLRGAGESYSDVILRLAGEKGAR